MMLYGIEEKDLAFLKLLARRLYKEERLDGDTQRNLAQRIETLIKSAENLRFDINRL